MSVFDFGATCPEIDERPLRALSADTQIARRCIDAAFWAAR
jgi:hypothetical protein